MTELKFSKYSGAGNDFILIDNREGGFDADSGLIEKMCARQIAVGADGLILLENSDQADIRMRYFNADGGEAEMCGNGSRCLIAFARKLGIVKDEYSFQTMERVLKARVKGDAISIQMGEVLDTLLNIDIEVDARKCTVHFTNTGVPHTILFVDDLDQIDLDGTGGKIRFHQRFQPKGTNVDFVTKTGKNSVAMRVYERGVEGETLACGTGVTAAGIIANLVHNVKPPVKVAVRSGDTLTVDFKKSDDKFSDVVLTGPATLIYDGTYYL